MPGKRKRGGAEADSKQDEQERSPTPTGSTAAKRPKKELQYDPGQASTSHSDEVDIAEIIQELFETIRNYKSEEGKLLCESFIRIPKRRTNPDYYEVVTQPMDMIKIQQKMKMDEYEEIEQLTADVELMVNNARAYYKKGSQEYIDATDLLDLYYEIRDELLVETFGDSKGVVEDDDDDDCEAEDTNVNIEQIQSKIASIVQQESAKLKGGYPSDTEEDVPYDAEDFEAMFGSLVNAQDGERTISEPFHLLPYKTLYPNYYDVITEPIDLKMIAKKVQDCEYKNLEDIDRDVALMVQNAKTFNEPKSLIFKDACTLKKVFDTKKTQIENRKTNAKTSERLRTRGSSSGQKLSAQFAALEYPEPIDPTDIMEYEEDSGAETVMSEEENPMWHLFNAVKNYASAEGLKIIEPFMKLPSKRYYPDYYEEIKKPLSIINVQKKLKTGYYTGLDHLATDIILVFENAKRYNADESIIYRNACLLQKVMREKKKELEKFGYKNCDEDHSAKKNTKKSATPVDTEKKRPPKKSSELDELLRKRLYSLYKSVHDYADNTGRLVRQIFMYLPSKKDYPDYYKVITDPIDLGIIESKIKANKYPSEYNLMSDFDLMFKNARHYNEEGSQVYSDAITLEKALKARWRIINQAAGTIKAGVKTKTRKGPTPSSLSAKLQDLYESIRDYQDVRGRTLSSPFMKVPLKIDYPDYYEVIKKPMDMSSIQSKMAQKRYESVEEMVADCVQMFDNACKYNEPDSLIYKDALTLQRVCLEKKVELSDDFTNEVPDVRAVTLEMMTNLFIATYNCQDEEGRCYSDSFSELPERDPGTDPNSERPLTFDKIKRNLDRGRYRRMDRFQDDMFKVFERARAHSRSDSQLYEDTVEMQMFFIRKRDELCKNGELLLTPALSYTDKHLSTIIESEKYAKNVAEHHEDLNKPVEQQNTPADIKGDDNENSLKCKDQVYTVGEFVYIEPRQLRKRSKCGRIYKKNLKYRDSDSEPHIMCIEKIYTDNAGQKQVYGNWFYRPNETFHLATRKFLQKEVLKSDVYASTDPNQIIGRCYVMNVREYFKLRPEGFADTDVYVCEFRYNNRSRSFKKIKIWTVPSNEVNLVDRDIVVQPIRVASVFADKDTKDEYFDDGDTSILEKEKIEILTGTGSTNDEGHIMYEQMKTHSGMYKIGDCIYVKSDLDKPTIYRIDRMWHDKYGGRYFYGPLFIRPCDIEHPPTRMFFKNEMFICGVEEARLMESIIGRCAVLGVREYCNCRPTEIPESDVFICESKYHEQEKTVRKLAKGLKKHTLSSRVTDDEVLFFRKHIVPVKEPSPLLAKHSEESISYDGDESRDTFSEVVNDVINMTNDDVNFHHTVVAPPPIEIKTPPPTTTKKAEEIVVAPAETHTKKKVKVKRLPNGYLIFSGYMRRVLQEEEKDKNYTFGEISRLVGVKWRNLEKEEKEKYEEKAKRIAEEQQAKQAAAEQAFNETLTKQAQAQQPQQQQYSDPGQSSTSGQSPRPSTPAQQGMHNGMGGAYMSPRGSPAMLPNGQAGGVLPRPAMGQFGSPVAGAVRQPFPGMTPISYGHGTQGAHMPQPQPGAHMGSGPYPGSPVPQQGMTQNGQQQMAPPPPPPRPPSPMFVTVPPRTQRLLHSEAYLKYIEGLNAENRTITEWDRTFTATPENTPVPDESRLPSHWLAQGAGNHGSVTDALWALRDLMLKDALNLQRTLPFEAL